MQALGLTESLQVRADADAESAVKARNHFILEPLEDLFICGYVDRSASKVRLNTFSHC